MGGGLFQYWRRGGGTEDAETVEGVVESERRALIISRPWLTTGADQELSHEVAPDIPHDLPDLAAAEQASLDVPAHDITLADTPLDGYNDGGIGTAFDFNRLNLSGSDIRPPSESDGLSDNDDQDDYQPPSDVDELDSSDDDHASQNVLDEPQMASQSGNSPPRTPTRRKGPANWDLSPTSTIRGDQAKLSVRQACTTCAQKLTISSARRIRTSTAFSRPGNGANDVSLDTSTSVTCRSKRGQSDVSPVSESAL